MRKKNIKMRSIEVKKYATVITLILVLCGIYLLTEYNEYNSNTVSYKVESCEIEFPRFKGCLLYTSPSPRDRTRSRMPSSA